MMKKSFNKVSCLMATALVLSAPVVMADDSPHEFRANVALSTDYLFRGISQTDGNPAISGGFDYSYTPYGFYAGIWSSNVDFSSFGDDDNIEIDYYGGFSGEFSNAISWDVGGLYYQYPGDDGNDAYWEAYGSLGYTFSDVQFEPAIGVTVAYSPDFFAGTGDGIWVNPTLDLSLPYDVGLSFSYGYQDVDDLGNYSNFSVGLSKDLSIFSFGLTYSNNFGESDFCGGADVCDDTVVFSISSSF